jgi:hypothetical protein
LDEPPRLQWEANFGYCGEVSLIAAGLYYGQYASQYQVRKLATSPISQNMTGSQVLLGVNAHACSTSMGLASTAYNSTSTDFLVWIRQNILQGKPVIIGLFMNQFLFYGNTAENAGDVEYDHIVPVTAVETQSSASDSAYHNDVLIFSDNGLYTPNLPAIQYKFGYSFDAFQRTRAEANQQLAPPYSLSKGTDFGLVVTGVLDPLGETFPVRVSTDKNFEAPSMVEGSDAQPAPMPLVLTVTVSGLTPRANYTLYRYNSFRAVPVSHFNANAAAANRSWPINIINGSTWTLVESILSSDIVIYRAVVA